MSFTHVKWEPTGKTEWNTSNPLQRRWTGSLNQKCTWDGSKWLPYLWKSAENKLQFAQDEEIEFGSDQQLLRRAGNVICSSMKLFVQAYVDGQWVDQPHGLPTKNITHDYPNNGACTGYLDFPDAHLSFGAQLPYDLQAGVEVSHFPRAILGLRLRAPVSGQLRFQVVLDGLTKLPADWEWIDSKISHDDQTSVHVGIRVQDLEWKWGKEEAPYRSITKEDNQDGTIKITITLGPYDYVANEWLIVYPDSWGPTSISSDANDGSEYSAGNSGSYAGTWDIDGSYGNGNLYLERDTTTASNKEKVSAWRWLPVITGTPTSIDTGTQIVFTNGGDNSNSTSITGTLRADNVANAPVWGSATARPSQRTSTTATVALTGSTGNQTINVASIVTEKVITEANPYDGSQGMAFWAECTSDFVGGTYYWSIANDYASGQTVPTLTIVYTVAGVSQIGSNSYGVTGNNTWTAPSDAVSNVVNVRMWGGGGGGGGGNTTLGGAGGGAGAFAQLTNYAITPGANHALTVGNGGAAGGAAANGVNGTITIFRHSNNANAGYAAPGARGVRYNTANSAGGTTAASSGNTTYKGGNGAGRNGTTGIYSGSGGGGAGSGGAGSDGGNVGANATGGAGGAGDNTGGNGGNASLNAIGANGNQPGGGGAGGGATNKAGGRGGVGYVYIFWYKVTPGDNATHANPIGIPTIGQTHIIPGDSTIQSHTPEVATYQHTHLVSSDSSNISLTSDQTTITIPEVIKEISPDNCLNGSSSDVPTVEQTHIVALDSCYHASPIGIPTLQQTHLISTDSCTQVSTLDIPTVIELRIITPDNCLNAIKDNVGPYLRTATGDYVLNAAGDRIILAAGRVTQTNIINPDNAIQPSIVDIAVLLQTYILSATNTAHAPPTDVATLFQTHLISPSNSVNPLSSTEPLVGAVTVFFPDNCLNGSSAQIPTLQQTHIISPNGCAQPSSSDQTTVRPTIIVDSCVHAQSLGIPTITQTHFVSPNSCIQPITSDEASVEGVLKTFNPNNAVHSTQDNAHSFLKSASGDYVLNAAGDKIILEFGRVRQTHIIAPDSITQPSSVEHVQLGMPPVFAYSCEHFQHADEPVVNYLPINVNSASHHMWDWSRISLLDEAGNEILDEAGNPIEIIIYGANVQQTGGVSPSDATNGSSCTEPTITQYTFTVQDNCTHLSSAASPSLVQTHIISPNASYVAPSSEIPLVVQTIVIVVDNEYHSQHADAPIIAWVDIALPISSATGQTTEIATLFQTHLISPNSAQQCQSVDHVYTLGVVWTIEPDDCTQSSLCDNIFLTSGSLTQFYVYFWLRIG